MRERDSEQPIETPRLTLEPLVVAHAEALYSALQAPDLYRFIPQDPPQSVEWLAARYARLAMRHAPDNAEIWLNWASRLRESDVYVGTVQATVFADHTALLAYEVFPPYWHRGFAREACAHVLAHLVAEYGVSRVAAEIDTRNAASIHLVEALGFTRVAMTPHADFFKGAPSDEYRYEWSATS